MNKAECFPERKWLLVFSLFVFLTTISRADSADLDSTNPIYNRAVNPLVTPSERLQALDTLYKQKGFDALETLFATLLSRKQPVLIKHFIIQCAKGKASETSPLNLMRIATDKQFDTETRRLALWELWRGELIEVKDLKAIINDSYEDLAVREYGVALLKEKSGYYERESRVILEDLATGGDVAETLRMQAIASLSQDLENPQTLGLFQKLVLDKSLPLPIRKFLLLNIEEQDKLLSSKIVHQILLDPREKADLRIFCLEITSDEAAQEKISDMRRLEATTTDPLLKEALAKRLSSIEK